MKRAHPDYAVMGFIPNDEYDVTLRLSGRFSNDQLQRVLAGHPIPKSLVDAMNDVEQQMKQTGHATYTSNGVETHMCWREESCDYTPPERNHV